MSNFQQVFVKLLVNLFSSMNCHTATLKVRWRRQRSSALATGCSCLCKITAYSPAVMWSRGAIIGCNSTRWSAAAPIMQLRLHVKQEAWDAVGGRRCFEKTTYYCNCFPPRLGSPGSQQLKCFYLLALDATTLTAASPELSARRGWRSSQSR